MKVLVACEFSGLVRDAFAARGHDAWSCDLLPTERPGKHIQGNVLDVLNDGWDLMIAHPPCTYTSQAGYRWFKTQPDRIKKARAGYELFMNFISAPIPMIAVENTRGLLWQWYRKPDQIIHPFHFGHPMTKATCLWLKNLPPLMATIIDSNPFVNWTKYKGSHTGHDRSRTFQGIADAMASQWGNYGTQSAFKNKDYQKGTITNGHT